MQAVDPALPTKLDGAWNAVSTGGPDAASQAASSLVESIEWFLRLGAPEADVLLWHASNDRPATEVTEQGHPTRGLRIEFLLVQSGRNAYPARHFTRGLIEILEFLQGVKHNRDFDDVAAVQRIIPAVEALFAFLVP